MKWTWIRRTVAASLLAFSLAGRVFADDIPTFSEPEVNAFVKSYAQFADDYVVAYQAMKAGDNSKLQALHARAPALQQEAAQMSGKLKPDETATFSTFISKCVQKITGTLQSQ
jgi:methionine synthase II (cobalamin-independent)